MDATSRQMKLNDQTVDYGRLVTFYTCGITPHAESHLGHARVFVTLDVIKRVLSGLLGCTVMDASNVTDIDDKIIRRAADEGVTVAAVADRYTAHHTTMMRRLDVREEHAVLRVTDCIADIIAFTARLVASGGAHVVPDGVRMAPPAPFPFSLWKRRPTSQPGWDSPWGYGRPGWHVECSTITQLLFGARLDFHAGGIDLASPHHDNECTQNAAYHGHDSVRTWLHVGHLEIEGLKMSKSLKNFVTIEECMARHSPQALRMFFLTSDWRKSLSYGADALEQAAKRHQYLEVFARLPTSPTSATTRDWLAGGARLVDLKSAVTRALLDNVDTRAAVTHLVEIVRHGRSGAVPFRPAQVFVGDTLRLLGFAPTECGTPPDTETRDAIAGVRCRLRDIAKGVADPDLRSHLFGITDTMRTLLPRHEDAIGRH